jgi:hypothetical protein
VRFQAGRVIWVFTPKPPISLIGDKFGVCLGVRLGVPITVLFNAVFHARNAKWNTNTFVDILR